MEKPINLVYCSDIIKKSYKLDLKDILDNMTFIFNYSTNRNMIFLLKVLTAISDHYKILFISLLDEEQKVSNYQINNLENKNLYIINDKKINITKIIEIIKREEIKAVVIDELELLEEFIKTNNKIELLNKFYNLKKENISIIIGMDFCEIVDDTIFNYAQNLSNVIMVS